MLAQTFRDCGHPHYWVMDTEKSTTNHHAYFVCEKTGDRKAIKDPADETSEDFVWLASGSGRYVVQETLGVDQVERIYGEKIPADAPAVETFTFIGITPPNL